MSSRYNPKRTNNIINKENDGGPLNMIKKAVPNKKELVEKKPSLKQYKSVIIPEQKSLEVVGAAESKRLEEEKKDEQREERKRDSQRFRRTETERVMAAYSKVWISDLKQKETKYWPKCFLGNHKISASVRAKMIDWMIEVLCSYKCTDMTFFVAIYYMDMYFQKTIVKHELNDLHLIGVAAMYVATKYEEICPLRISVMQSKISHGKFTKEEIKCKETDLLQVLSFHCSPVTILNFLEIGIESLKLKDILSEALYNHLNKLSVYIGKMIMHEYELLSKYSQSEFSVACIYIGLKIVQQLEPTFKIESYAFKLRTIFDISESAFFECSQTCLDLAKNFESKYPSLTNLAKFHTFSLETTTSQVETSPDAQNSETENEA